jgi:hypothetical protein
MQFLNICALIFFSIFHIIMHDMPQNAALYKEYLTIIT